MGQLIKTAGWDNVVIFPEFPPEQVPAMFDLLQQTRQLWHSQTWRPFSDEEIEARVNELFRRIVGSGRDPELPMGDDIGQPRYGLKQPRAESYHDRLAVSLGPFRPQYVYRFRDPITAYRSFQGISLAPTEPKIWASWLDISSRAAVSLAASGDLFPVDTEKWAAEDRSLRSALVDRLFAFLGLSPTSETGDFVATWPGVNRSSSTVLDTPNAERLARRRKAEVSHYRERTRSLQLP